MEACCLFSNFQEAASARAEGIKMVSIGVTSQSQSAFRDELLAVTGNNEDAVFEFTEKDLRNTSILEAVHDYICRGQCFWVSNQAIAYKCQNFLKVVVHVIIIDQCNQTAS